MRSLVVFNHVSLDGYFVDGQGSMQWAKGGRTAADPEWDAFVAQNTRGESTLLFGRVTYELMSGYWPTPQARQRDAALAERMNALPKVVFSRTLERATWSNTTLVKDDLVTAVRRMKQEPGHGLVILGSGRIVAQLAVAQLIDEYQIVVNPVVLGRGRTMFEGVPGPLPLERTATRAFGNGDVLVCYRSRP